MTMRTTTKTIQKNLELRKRERANCFDSCCTRCDESNTLETISLRGHRKNRAEQGVARRPGFSTDNSNCAFQPKMKMKMKNTPFLYYCCCCLFCLFVFSCFLEK